MFWLTFSFQILITFSFLESPWHKATDQTIFAKKLLQTICKQPVEGNLHIFSFSQLHIRLFKILQNFLHIWNGMVKGFSKMYNLSFFGQFFLQTFLLYNWILKKKFNFCKFTNFFADSKSRAQELSNDVSFVIFGHQTCDLEGGSNWTPPQRILVFKYPSRDCNSSN